MMPSIAARRAIVLRAEHPDWILQHIGDEVGLSRERVRQILKGAGLSSAKAQGYRELADAIAVPRARRQPRQMQSIPCDNCGKPRNIYPYQLISREHHFCSPSCYRVWQRANTRRKTANCAFCGKLRRLNGAQYATARKGHNIFCDRACCRAYQRLHRCPLCGKPGYRPPVIQEPVLNTPVAVNLA